MKYRNLSRTDLTLSEVGFGLWTLSTGLWGMIDEPDGIRLLEEAVELGITYFDTADSYGEGYGEEIIAKALPRRRHDIVIGTKFGYDFYNKDPFVVQHDHPQRFEPDFIRYACEQSLRRLHTDYIDLYQLHNPNMETLEKDEVFEVMEQLVKEGKIRYYAASMAPDVGSSEVGEAMMYRDLSAVQITYNILEQEPARSIFPIAERYEIGIICRGPHASEVLTGKYDNGTPKFDTSDNRSHRSQEWFRQALAKATTVRFLAEDTGRSLAQSAVAFCLAQPTVASVLPNITTMEELHEYAAVSDITPISEEELAMLEELWAEGFYLEQPAAVAAERD